MRVYRKLHLDIWGSLSYEDFISVCGRVFVDSGVKPTGTGLFADLQRLGSATLELIDDSPQKSVYQIRETQDAYPHIHEHIVVQPVVKEIEVKVDFSLDNEGDPVAGFGAEGVSR